MAGLYLQYICVQEGLPAVGKGPDGTSEAIVL